HARDVPRNAVTDVDVEIARNIPLNGYAHDTGAGWRCSVEPFACYQYLGRCESVTVGVPVLAAQCPRLHAARVLLQQLVDAHAVHVEQPGGHDRHYVGWPV